MGVNSLQMEQMGSRLSAHLQERLQSGRPRQDLSHCEVARRQAAQCSSTSGRITAAEDEERVAVVA